MCKILIQNKIQSVKCASWKVVFSFTLSESHESDLAAPVWRALLILIVRGLKRFLKESPDRDYSEELFKANNNQDVQSLGFVLLEKLKNNKRSGTHGPPHEKIHPTETRKRRTIQQKKLL